MVPLRYVEFYDVPRTIAVRYRGKLLLLQSVFDEQLDDYPAFYSVYLLPESVQDSLNGSSWKFLETIRANSIGQILIASVKFDASKRVSLDPSCLDDIIDSEDSK